MTNTLEKLKEDLQFIKNGVLRLYDLTEILDIEGKFEEAEKWYSLLKRLRNDYCEIRSLIEEQEKSLLTCK